MSLSRALLFGALFWAVPAFASAATLSVLPSTATLAKGDTIIVELVVDAPSSINTVGVALFVPQGLRWIGSEKGAILTQWIDEPNFEAADSTAYFSGLIAGGWKGKGTLIKMQFVAQQAGTYAFAYDPGRTEIYQNDGKGTREPLTFGTVGSSAVPPALLGLGFALVLLAWIAWYLRGRVRLRFV